MKCLHVRLAALPQIFTLYTCRFFQVLFLQRGRHALRSGAFMVAAMLLVQRFGANASGLFQTNTSTRDPYGNISATLTEILNFIQANYLWEIPATLIVIVLIVILARPRKKESGGLPLDGIDIPRKPQLGSTVTVVQTPTVDAQTKIAASPLCLRLQPVGLGDPIELPVERAASPGGCIVGRDAKSDGFIAEKTVSKRHARLMLNARRELVIEDLGSSNGTWKGERMIAREVFESGDSVRFGNSEFRIELPGAMPRKAGSRDTGPFHRACAGGATGDERGTPACVVRYG